MDCNFGPAKDVGMVPHTQATSTATVSNQAMHTEKRSEEALSRRVKIDSETHGHAHIVATAGSSIMTHSAEYEVEESNRKQNSGIKAKFRAQESNNSLLQIRPCTRHGSALPSFKFHALDVH